MGRLVSDPATTPQSAVRLLLSLVIAVTVVAPLMVWLTLHSFAGFDDEGYYLLALAALAHHHPLYSQVYGTYGPAYYLIFVAAYTVLHIPYTPDAARVITVVCWCVSCLLSGLVLWRASRSVLVAVAAALVCFEWLAPIGLTGELYPGLILIPLQLSLVLALPSAVLSGRRIPLMAVGAILGTVLLIKVNVGIFTVASVVVAMAATVGRPRFPAWLWRLTCTVALLMPPVLVLALIGTRSVQSYLALSEVAILALLITVGATRGNSSPGLSAARMLLAIGGSMAIAILVYVAALAHSGTGIATVFRFTINVPLQQTHAFTDPVQLGFGALVATIAVATLSTQLVWRRRASRSIHPHSHRLRATLAITKIAVGLGIVFWGLVGAFPLGPVFGAAAMGLVGIWVGLERHSPQERSVIWLLAALGAFQQLQIYPVAGAQIASGTVWVGLAALVLVDDGIRILPRSALPAQHVTAAAHARWLATSRTALVLGMGCVVAIQSLDMLASSPRNAVSLDLRGSDWIYLPKPTALAYRHVTHYLQDSCSTFISAPGIDSLYTWTGQRPVLGILVDDWMYLVSAPQQRAIVRELEVRRHICAVVDPLLIEFWQHGTPLPPDPILHYLAGHYVVVRRFGGIYIMQRSVRPTLRASQSSMSTYITASHRPRSTPTR